MYVEAYGIGLSTVTASTLTDGSYELAGLSVGTYTVRVTYEVDGIESSAEKETTNGTADFDFTLEINYTLASVQGVISGIKPSRIASSGIKPLRTKSEVPSYAFVEIRRSRAVMRIPIASDGSFRVKNLLPGEYSMRAFDGENYSRVSTVKLFEGQTLDVKFAFPLSVSSVYCQPNPGPDTSGNIYICFIGNQSYGAEVKIYTITGEKVRGSKNFENFTNTDSENGKRFIWNLKNDGGRVVASGVYFYILEVKDLSSGESKKFKGKIAIVK